MKKASFLIVLVVFLFLIILIELFYFLKLQKKPSQISPTFKELGLIEKERVKNLAQQAQDERAARKLVYAAEASKTANLKPLTQKESCYLFSQDQILLGAISKNLKENLIYIEYEGRFKNIEEIDKDGCSFFKLNFAYTQPFSLYLPKDLFLETEQGKVNASFLSHYPEKRIGLALAYQQEGEQFLIKKWQLVRFYVE